MALRSLAMILWFGGWLIRVGSHHEIAAGGILWLAGIVLDIYVDYRMDWEIDFPRHMTAFTGFVLALVIVFGVTPIVGDSVKQGDHIPGNPFNSRDYRVAEVLTGDPEKIPMIYLGSMTSAYLDFAGEAQQRLDGKFTYITQPEGTKTRGIWELLDGEKLYRVTLENDDTVTMACLEGGQVLWKYRLQEAPKAGCTILDVLGNISGMVDWYYADSFDIGDEQGSFPLRAKGTVKLSVPGNSETVTIYEEFRDGEQVEYQTMTLTRDKKGFVEFKRETRQNGGNQTGIYRIPYQDGEFVLVLKFVK